MLVLSFLFADHVVSKKTTLDIIFDSADFEHLYVRVNGTERKKWRLDFFINPPPGMAWLLLHLMSCIEVENMAIHIFEPV